MPPVLLRAAGFYWAINEHQRALEQIGKVMRLTAAYDDAIFGFFFRNRIPAKEIIPYLPEGPRAAQAYFGYLVVSGNRWDTPETWAWLLAQHYADDKLGAQYARWLFLNRRYDLAAQVSADGLGDKSEGYFTKNYVFNGSFELDGSRNPYDWVLQDHPGAKASIDDRVAFAGRRSARIEFDGTKNLDVIGLFQDVYLPAGAYRFEARIKTEGITTDQGIWFQISGAGLKAETGNVIGTNDWQLVEKPFDAPQSGLVHIQLFRRPSLKFDSLIKGTAWIDQVRIVPRGKP